ncbi:hypothetical protein ACFSKI_00985 [Pseudogracilibacillus auburnensis]|nr:hypothetical protein [Pseudogracilibacillus auburnensis]
MKSTGTILFIIGLIMFTIGVYLSGVYYYSAKFVLIGCILAIGGGMLGWSTYFLSSVRNLSSLDKDGK